MAPKYKEKLQKSQVQPTNDVVLVQLKYYIRLVRQTNANPSILMKLKKRIFSRYALLSPHNQTIYAPIITQIFDNLGMQCLESFKQASQIKANKHLQKYLQTLQTINQQTQQPSEYDVESYFQSLSADQLPIFSPSCIRCWKFIYEGQSLTSISQTQQVYKISSFKKDDEVILQEIMGVGNDGGVLIVGNPKQEHPRRIYGRKMTEGQKVDMVVRLKKKIQYLMPQIKNFVTIQYVPMKKIINVEGSLVSRFISGEYVLRIYFKNFDRRKLIFKSFKGGKLKELSKYSVFRFEKQEIRQLTSQELYHYMHKKYEVNRKYVCPHYGMECLGPDQGKPIWAEKQQEDKNDEEADEQIAKAIPQKNLKFKNLAYMICKRHMEGSVITKIEKALKTNKMQFRVEVRYVEEVVVEENRDRCLLYLYHEDSLQVIRKKIKYHDPTLEVGLKAITDYIDIQCVQIFQANQQKIKKKLCESMKIKPNKIYNKQIIETKNDEVNKEGKPVGGTYKEILLSINQPEILEQLYYQIFKICNFRAFSFLSPQQYIRKKTDAFTITPNCQVL